MSLNPLNWFRKSKKGEGDERWKKEMEEKEKRLQETLRSELEALEKLKLQDQETQLIRMKEDQRFRENALRGSEESEKIRQTETAKRNHQIQQERLHFEEQMSKLQKEKHENDMDLENRMDVQRTEYENRKNQISESGRSRRELEMESERKRRMDSEKRTRKLQEDAADHEKKLLEEHNRIARSHEEFQNKLNFERNTAQQDWEQRKLQYQEQFEKLRSFMELRQWNMEVLNNWKQKLEFLRSTKTRALGSINRLVETIRFGIDGGKEIENIRGNFLEIQNLLSSEAESLEKMYLESGHQMSFMMTIREALLGIIRTLEQDFSQVGLHSLQKLSIELEVAYNEVPTIQQIQELMSRQREVCGSVTKEQNEDGETYLVEEVE